MNKDLFKKILPHLIAVGIFLIAAVIYCSPALQGLVVNQHDITSWKGAIQKSIEYKNEHGQYPLWVNNVFSGMPAFQIGAPGNSYLPGFVHTILTLGLPQPIQFFFLACVCFYFLCVVLRIRPVVGILGALAFAYATYNPVIITAGHVTKMWSIAYMPAVLASVLLIYQKKYFTGAALTALFSATMVAMNHLQIVYYLFIAIAIITIFFIVQWIKEKETRHLMIALSLTAVAALIGSANNAVGLLPTYEYQKYTIRGGASYLTDTTVKAGNKSKDGLDRDYAMAYSLDIAEPLVMAVPRMFGGSSGGNEFKDDSKTIEAMQQIGQQNVNAIAQSTGVYLPQLYSAYWGGIKDVGGNVGTSGPPYIGAIVCLLALLGFFAIKSRIKWGVAAAIFVSILLSWGSYFSSLNDLMFDYFPLYNKFRAPSMILVIPQLLLPVLAVWGLHSIIETQDKKSLWPQLKKGMIATGALIVLLLFASFSFDYMSSVDKDILKAVRGSGQQQLIDIFKNFYDGLTADRKDLFMGDLLRTVGFMALAGLIVWLMIRNTIKPVLAVSLLAAFVFIDLITIDNKYLNKDEYQEKTENDMVFQKTAFDETIHADKSYFRVFNKVAGNNVNESITSYQHNSVGGYHAAKLRIYQDIIEKQIGGSNPNRAVLNMLNAKYFIEKETNSQQPNYGHTISMEINEQALGACWLVKNVKFVKNADEEMNALNTISPADTAIVQEAFKSSVTAMPVYDSAAFVKLEKNENDKITYSFNAASPQFAVFSEVYYPAGWKAFIDGKEVPIIKTNYVLRGLAVPAGKHAIEFRFEPQGYINGRKITAFSSYLLIALIALAGLMAWRKKKSV